MVERCKKCKYRVRLDSSYDKDYICDYISRTGHRRLCPADENCDKFEPKAKSNFSRKLFNPNVRRDG